MYDENPLAIGSCWGLEVEMFDRIERKWLRLDDFPNPGDLCFYYPEHDVWVIQYESYNMTHTVWLTFTKILVGYGNEVFDTISLKDRVYTFGGYWKNGTWSDHVYQFKNYKWSLVGDLLAPRGASFAARFDREIFIIGGYPNAEFYPV